MKARLGRPKKWKNGFKLTSLMIPRECEELWEKVSELSQREDSTISEVVNRALAEYLKIHYPGQPQPPIEECTTDAKMDAYLDGRAVLKAERFLEWREKYPSSPLMDAESVRLINFIRRVRHPSLRLSALVEKLLINQA